MKKALLILANIFFVSAIITSCGGSNTEDGAEKTIVLPDPPTDIKYQAVPMIDGPLSSNVEAISDLYLLEIEKDENSYSSRYNTKIKVKFRFTNSIDVKAGRGYNYYGPGITGKILDDKGAPLDLSLEITTDEDLATYLKRGSGEEWLVLKALTGSIESEEEALKILDTFKKGTSIRFNSEIVEEKFESSNSGSESSESESSSDSKSAENCEEFLDGYEKFMDDYIAIIKKMKNNPTDQTILTEYTSMMTEAAEWSTKTADCAADAKFAAKFAAIQVRIANAASNL